MKKNFHTDLKFGQDAEGKFNEKFPSLTRTDGRAGDFLLPGGELLELKVERRPSTQTGNIFFEHYSHRDKQTPGGPFKALQDNAVYFAHWFMADDKLFIFDTKVLVNFLLDSESKFRYHYVRGSNSTGYIVPIVSVGVLGLDKEILNVTKEFNQPTIE